MDEMELDLSAVLYTLRRRLWMVLVVPLVAAMATWVVSAFFVPPTYEAAATLWVVQDGGQGQMDYNALLLSRNLARTYAEIARSRTVLQQVIDQLGLDLTVTDLERRLTASAVRDTEIISLKVQDGDPGRAAAIANAVAAAFQERIRSYMKTESVTVVDPAVPSASPVKPRVVMNTAVALVLGAIVAVGLAFLLEVLDTSIRTHEDVDHHLCLPVLATIPDFAAVAELARSQHPVRVPSATGAD